jgi:uracil-DNA glycosylase family 4
MSDLTTLSNDIIRCRRCPRLVHWRETVAEEKRAAFRDEVYWGRPVPSFGDPRARVLVVGLAPAAHGANRTGRMFTGDRSGEWLFRALHRAGFATQAESTAPGDGLELRDLWLTAAVHCAPPENRPLPEERDACAPYLAAELQLLLPHLRVVVALGAFAWTQVLVHLAQLGEGIPRPRPKFGHGAHVRLERGSGVALNLLGSYHPSQQNTFTGTLTEPAFDAVWAHARRLLT